MGRELGVTEPKGSVAFCKAPHHVLAAEDVTEGMNVFVDNGRPICDNIMRPIPARNQPEIPAMRRCTFPAPRREAYQTDNEHYATRPWTTEGVKDVLSYGGWFAPGSQFASKKVAEFALAGVLDLPV